MDVSGTPFDFIEPQNIGRRLEQNGTGFDHCYVINSDGSECPFAATVYEPVSGKRMDMFTTEPGVQFYTGNFLDGSDECGNFVKHGGICLEAEKFPDSPNHKHFPSAVVRPEESYDQVTIYRFS
jgi:aldose 1-epimerase